MFESTTAPARSAHDDLPAGWAVMLESAAAPAEEDPLAATRREAEVALRGGGWQPAVVWGWTWNTTGRPVRWRCQVEVADVVHWYYYEDRHIRLTDRHRPTMLSGGLPHRRRRR